MNRPASLAGSLPSPASLGRAVRGLMPSRRGGIKIGLITVAVVAVIGLILVYSPIAHPRDLQVDGVTGSNAAAIQDAIEGTAHGQSTFAVSEADLMKSVAAYPQVAAIKIDAHPPFRLDLDVLMRPPVATAVVGGHSFILASDGTVLDGIANADVPKIDASIEGLEIRETTAKGASGVLRILGAAPEPLLKLARSIRAGGSGIEVVMQRGPRIIFGNSSYAADKWAAAAAVLADGPAARASYIDVRVPGRPAVGGLGGSHAAGYTDAPPVLDDNSATAAAAATSAAATQATPQQAAASQAAAAAATAETQAQAPAAATGATTGGTGTASTDTASTGTAATGGPASQAASGTATDTPSGTADTTSGTVTGATQTGQSSSGGASLGGTATP